MTGLNFPTKAQRFDYLNKKEIEDKLDIDLDLLDLRDYAKLGDLDPLLSKDEASDTYVTKAELSTLEDLVDSLATRVENLENSGD